MGTNTDRAPASVTISGKDTQYGTGTRTSSPSSKSARQAVCSACLPPAVTMTSEAVYGASHAARYRSAIASRSSGIPEASVYFVKSDSIASIAACFTNAGVGKSGSPGPKSTTSIPLARSVAAAFMTANVAEPATREARDANLTGASGCSRRPERRAASVFQTRSWRSPRTGFKHTIAPPPVPEEGTTLSGAP